MGQKYLKQNWRLQPNVLVAGWGMHRADYMTKIRTNITRASMSILSTCPPLKRKQTQGVHRVARLLVPCLQHPLLHFSWHVFDVCKTSYGKFSNFWSRNTNPIPCCKYQKTTKRRNRERSHNFMVSKVQDRKNLKHALLELVNSPNRHDTSKYPQKRLPFCCIP